MVSWLEIVIVFKYILKIDVVSLKNTEILFNFFKLYAFGICRGVYTYTQKSIKIRVNYIKLNVY